MISNEQNRPHKLDGAERMKQAEAFISNSAWKVLSVKSARSLNLTIPPATSSVWYTKGIIHTCLREVVELLAKQSKVIDPVLDGAVLEGEWYHHTAMWRRDGGEQSKDGSFTLFRYMGPESSGFEVVTESGCTTRTSIRFVWDSILIEEPPAAAQGFERQIGGASRDPESNLYTYYVATTEALTYHTTAFITSDDTFQTTYRESWTGLRGTKAAPTDSDGNSVTIPSPTADANGTTVQVSWVHNDRNCTWNVSVDKQVAKTGVVASVSCSKDQFAEQDSTQTSAQAAALGHAPAPAAGVSTTHRSQSRPDGKFDNTLATNKELNVLLARLSRQEDLFSSQTARVDRGQTAAPAAPSATGGTIISTGYEKSPGMLFSNSTNTTVEKPVENAQVTKAASIFETSESVAGRSLAAEPAAPVAGDGKTQTTSVSKTPGDMKNVQVNTRQEITVAEARVAEQRNLFGYRKNSLTRSTPDAIPLASSADGVGISVNSSKTDGGWSNVETSREEEIFVEAAQVANGLSIFEANVSSVDRNSPDDPPSASASGGTIISVNADRTPHGRRNISVNTKLELPVTEATVDQSGDIFKESVQWGDVNVEDPGDLSVFNPSQGVLLRRARAKTPGNMRRVTESQVTFKTVEDAQVASSGSLHATNLRETDVNINAIPAITTGFIAAGSPIKSLQYRKTGADQYEATISTDAPGPFREYTITSLIYGTSAKEYVVIFVNATEAKLTEIVARYPYYHVVPGYGWNAFALMNGQIKFVPYLGRGSSKYARYQVIGLKEVRYETITEAGDGKTYERKMTVIYDLVLDQGHSTGKTSYAGALSGSSFEVLDELWYRYKKVTSITTNHTEMTGVDQDKTYTATP